MTAKTEALAALATVRDRLHDPAAIRGWEQHALAATVVSAITLVEKIEELKRARRGKKGSVLARTEG